MGDPGPSRLEKWWTGNAPRFGKLRERSIGKYLARGGAHQVHEGDWVAHRIVVPAFPPAEAWGAFYNGPVYQGLKPIRDACRSARLVSIEGRG